MPGFGPCFSCLFPEPPAPADELSPAQAGIVGAVAGAFGAMQAVEIIKLLLNQRKGLLLGRLFCLDMLTMKSRAVPYKIDPTCPVCSNKQK
jgi:molybdopterin/thiamine biosynthesis adenylyltransferase